MLEPSKNRAKEEKKSRRTCLEKGLIASVILVSVVALVFLVLYFLCSPYEEECKNKYCVKASAELLDFIDLKKDPCNDFYHFVCGQYIKDAVKNDAPTPILEIDTLVKNEKKAIIVDPIKKKDSSSNVAMKKFYQACMNETLIDANNETNFWEAINELGGWPLVNGSDWEGSSFDWVDWHIKSVELGIPVIGFFDFRPAKVSGNTTNLRVTKSDIVDVHLSKSDYRALMGDIAKAFHISRSSDEITEAYEFLKSLKKLAEDYEEDDDDESDISTVEDLHRECPKVPWLKLLNGLSQDVREITNETYVVYGSIRVYCEKLHRVLKGTSNRIVADFYVWSIIHKSYNFLSRKIRNAYDSMEDENPDRFGVCFNLTDKSFTHLKETIYIRRKTNPHVKSQLEELIDIMKNVFIKHIKASTWMDDETKQRGIEKTMSIEKVIGAEDILYDVEKFDKILGVDGLEFSTDIPYQILREKRMRENKHIWEMVDQKAQDEGWGGLFSELNAVNAFFSPQLNVMVITAPILNSVFFNYKLPAFMNYGSIGRVVAHEIQHGFGEFGRFLLKDNQRVDWWSNATAQAFNETKQCAIKEYEQIPFKYKLNGRLTLEENLADFVGIDVAYEAYAEWVRRHGEERQLPGIPLTPKQIFWVQTGTNLCFRKLDDNEVDMTKEDDHAIPSFRVTAGARNSRYFADDFKCSQGSFMNPKEKCRIL